jgi:hypothetical protein
LFSIGEEYNPSYVKVASVKSDKTKISSNTFIRTKFFIPLTKRKGANKTVSTVLMNPSAASDNVSDKTINFVIEYIYENIPKACAVIINNLFPFCEGNSKLLYDKINSLNNNDYNAAMLNNISSIKTTISKASYTFLGYGQFSGKVDDQHFYDEATSELLKLIERSPTCKLYVFETTQSSTAILIRETYPRHPYPNNPHYANNHHECYIQNEMIKLK